MSYEVGAEAAKRNVVIMTIGLGGVTEEACKGAKENHGTTVGTIPHDEMNHANPYCDIVIATGTGWARDFATAHSADAVIAVTGGVGILIETCIAHIKANPVVALEGSGGVADQVGETCLNERKSVRTLSEHDPKRAVEKALSLAQKSFRS